MNKSVVEKPTIVYFDSQRGYAQSFRGFCDDNNVGVRLIFGEIQELRSVLEKDFHPVAVINVSDISKPIEELRRLRSETNDTQIIVISEKDEHALIQKLLSAPNPIADAALGSKDEFQVRELFGRCKEFLEDWEQSSKSIKVNFDTDIDEVLLNFTRSWSGISRTTGKISIDRVKTELRIVISKLFSSGSDSDREQISSEIDVSTLRGSGKSSSFLFRLTPRINLNSSLRKSAVLKFGPKAEVKLESRNYDKYVEWFLTVQQTVRKIGYEETTNYAGLLYSFPMDSEAGYDSFAEYIRRHTTEATCEIIGNLFSTDNRHWLAIDGAGFDHGMPDDMQSYYITHGIRTDQRTLRQNFEKIVTELNKIGIQRGKEILSEQDDYLSFPILGLKIPNPVKWIMKPFTDRINLSLVHGDLHANNILIDEHGKCFFIDFYYTGFGHIFRDFIDLELSVRYDLLCSKQIVNEHDRLTRLDSKDINVNGLKTLILLEKDIIKFHAKGKPLDARSKTAQTPHLRKAYDIVTKIREMAFANFPGKANQYYLAIAYTSVKAIKYFYPLDVRLYRLIISGLYFEMVGQPQPETKNG